MDQMTDALRSRYSQILVENSTDIHVLMDLKGIIQFVNPSIQEILGYSFKDIVGKAAFDFIHTKDLDNITRNVFFRAVQNPGINYLARFRFKHQDGTWRILEGNSRCFVGESGEKWVVVNCRDITEMISKQTQVERTATLREEIAERRKTESELQESEAKYHDLYDSAPVAYLSVDPDGLIWNANKAAQNFTGYDLEELLSMKVLKLYDMEWREKAKLLLNRLKAGQAWINEEMVYKRKNGKKIHGLLSANPIKNNRGKVIKSRSVIVDITERIRSQRKLQESEEKLRRIIESSPDAITVTDLDGTIVECNQATLDMHGFNRREDVIGKSAFMFFPPEELKKAEKNMLKTVKEGSIKNVEYTLLKRDGTEFPAELSASIIKDLDEKPISFVAITKDISERKEAERSLRESEERFRLIAENIEDVVWLGGAKDELGIYYFNPAFERVWGFDPKEIYEDDINIWKTVHEEDRAKFDQVFEDYLRTGEGFNVEFRIIRPEGSIRWIFARGFSIKDESGKIYRTVGIAQDITDRRKAEDELKRAYEELQELDKLKDEFYTDVTHEFRTPLVAIKGFTELLSNSRNLDEAQQQDLEIILKNERRLEQLVNEMLEYSRLKTGAVVFRKDKFQISEILDELQHELAPFVQENQLRIEAELNSDDELTLDKYQISKVIKNLLTNAIKFSIPEGIIHVNSTITDGSWIFSVHDQGIGIAKADLPKIFNRFTRLQTAKNMNVSGIGLGLALSKKIIEVYDGEIWVESEGVNKGATFSFQLKFK